MKDKMASYLRERGFEIDNLSPEGEIFAIVTAKAQERARQFSGDNFAQTRAIVTEFCKMVVGAVAARDIKPGLLGKDFEEVVAINALIRVFGDPEKFEKWVKED